MENKEIQLATDIDINHEEIEIIGINAICRLCANQNDHLIGVYSEEGISKDLATKINLYLPVKVSVTDELPLQCCWSCTTTILAWHELVLASVESDRKFRNSQFIGEKHIIEEAGYDNQEASPAEENRGLQETIKSEDDTPISDDEDTKPIKIEPDAKPPKRTSKFDQVADLATKTCIECSVTFATRTLLKNHVKETHKLEPKRHRRRNAEIVATFFCDVCEKGFSRKHDMQRHRLRLHSEQPLKDSPRENNNELLNKCRRRDSEGKVFYECDFCERVFAQSYNLTRHRTIHTGVKAFFCHICGKSFRMSNGLTRHIDAFHYGVKNFQCEVCQKSFTARASLDEHMNIHTNSRPFVCDVCGKSFKQRASLHVHKMFHTDLYRFLCSNCGKKFRRAQDLKVHSWLHTGHRPYSCGKCKASFRLSNDLKRHLKRVHEKSNECVCDDCGSVFTQERYLKVHRKIHKRPNLKLEETK